MVAHGEGTLKYAFETPMPQGDAQGYACFSDTLHTRPRHQAA